AVGTASPARAIRRAAMQALPSMRGQEGEAVKALGRFVKDDADRAAAIQALSRIPARQWPTEQVRPQLADALAALLPLEEARRMRRELGELGVRVLRLGTVTEQMIYDKERLVVQAGKPFEVQFENTDTMPHNLVFIQ